jgi:hypothetical protein
VGEGLSKPETLQRLVASYYPEREKDKGTPGERRTKQRRYKSM